MRGDLGAPRRQPTHCGRQLSLRGGVSRPPAGDEGRGHARQGAACARPRAPAWGGAGCPGRGRGGGGGSGVTSRMSLYSHAWGCPAQRDLHFPGSRTVSRMEPRCPSRPTPCMTPLPEPGRGRRAEGGGPGCGHRFPLAPPRTFWVTQGPSGPSWGPQEGPGSPWGNEQRGSDRPRTAGGVLRPKADAIRPRIIRRINRQTVHPIVLCGLEGCECHPSPAWACPGTLRHHDALVHKPQVQRGQPSAPVLPLPGSELCCVT